MLDDRLDDQLRDAAKDYNDPPETPRDVMWERIVAERAKKVETVLPLRHLRPLRWAAGIAAVLALGIGLGRVFGQGPRGSSTLPSGLDRFGS